MESNLEVSYWHTSPHVCISPNCFNSPVKKTLGPDLPSHTKIILAPCGTYFFDGCSFLHRSAPVAAQSPQRLCPRSLWGHPPWTRITAPHLPMSPVQALGGAARFCHFPSPCFRRQKGPIEKLRDGRGRDLMWPLFRQYTQQPTEFRLQ